MGRQVIGIKICSCPKRDKEKEERNVAETSSGKRKVKVKKDEKKNVTEEPPLKCIKQEFPLDTSNSKFTVIIMNIFWLLHMFCGKWKST